MHTFNPEICPRFALNPESRASNKGNPHPEPYLAQSRNPDGYFRDPASRAYFQFRILLPFCYKIDIPNAGIQIRQTPHLEEPISDSLGTTLLDSKLR